MRNWSSFLASSVMIAYIDWLQVRSESCARRCGEVRFARKDLNRVIV